MIVFCNSVPSARSTALSLGEAGYACASLHGDMPPLLRAHEFSLFSTGACQLLVATDSAARGLDFGGGGGAAGVVLFDFPRTPIEYLHRVGRTGRGVGAGGGGGQVVAQVGKGDEVLARAIERATARGEDVSVLSADKYAYVPDALKGGYKAKREAVKARWGAKGADGGKQR